MSMTDHLCFSKNFFSTHINLLNLFLSSQLYTSKEAACIQLVGFDGVFFLGRHKVICVPIKLHFFSVSDLFFSVKDMLV